MKTKLAIVATILGAIAAPVAADEIVCRTTLSNRTIDGNVLVPNRASCVLQNVYVKGNVELRDRSQLIIRNQTFVEGSVQTDGASRVRIRDSEINGNIQLTGVDYDLGSLVINTKVGGTIDWKDNDAPMLIRLNQVIADIKVNQNNRLARIFDNRVNGNLQCQSNRPAPQGEGNRVGGNKEDQCRRF
jgi:hypothetical protein